MNKKDILWIWFFLFCVLVFLAGFSLGTKVSFDVMDTIQQVHDSDFQFKGCKLR